MANDQRRHYRIYRPEGYLFNGKVAGERWVKRSAQWCKNKLAPFRKLCAAFRAVMLAGRKHLLAQEQIAYHRPFAELEAKLLQKRCVVNHQRPTADTKVIESDRQYLARHVLHQGRSPPSGQADKAGAINTSSRGGETCTALI